MGDSYNKKSEKFEGEIWSEIQEPPIDAPTIHSYAVIFYGSNHYFFGGYSAGNELSSILALQKKYWTWSNVGKMKTTRAYHEVILIGNRFMLIGGDYIKKNEACQLFYHQFNCTEFSSSLQDYFSFPILYLVDDDYRDC